MTAKGSPAWYAARLQPQPTTKPAPRSTMARCPNAACGLSYLSYHLKCPFCGTTQESAQ